MDMYTYTREDLEEQFDNIKALVADAIGYHFKLNEDEVEEWCKSHTIIIRKKSIFRTITDFWAKEKESQSGFYAKIVTNVLSKKEEINEPKYNGQ